MLNYIKIRIFLSPQESSSTPVAQCQPNGWHRRWSPPVSHPRSTYLRRWAWTKKTCSILESGPTARCVEFHVWSPRIWWITQFECFNVFSKTERANTSFWHEHIQVHPHAVLTSVGSTVKGVLRHSEVPWTNVICLPPVDMVDQCWSTMLLNSDISQVNQYQCIIYAIGPPYMGN